ncbi:MAG TPA: DUF2171 domain-containing protein [Sphingomicrobium sp.]|nr:DUF2171 domain-containing protein [Sphingomicrobium sp.]
MAYDRYDTRHGPRESRSRWSDERPDERGWRGEQGRSDRDERGFFQRAGEEISSWFGSDDDDDRDDRRYRDSRGERERFTGSGRSFGRDEERSGPSRSWSREPWGGESERNEQRDFYRDEQRGRGGYRPMTGDYGRSEGAQAGSGYNRGAQDWNRGRSDWDRDEYRRTSFAGSSDRSHHPDPHYQSWRQRQVEDLDREYEEYRRENQARFESDFGNWRSQRQTKRQMLGQVREHMEVFGNDEQRVGTVDRVAGDRIILTKNDPEAGGVHHSLTCTDIERVEGNRVVLGCSAEQAKQRWRDEDKGRALFEREDQGEAGPHMLDRSFSGTYR